MLFFVVALFSSPTPKKTLHSIFILNNLNFKSKIQFFLLINPWNNPSPLNTWITKMKKVFYI